jgi:hypothetical protein
MSDWIWIHYTRARPHWYELEVADRDAKLHAWARVRGESERLGGRCHGRYHIRGQSDYTTVEIWNFQSVEHAFDHWSRLTSAGYAEWFLSANNIGLQDEVSD